MKSILIVALLGVVAFAEPDDDKRGVPERDQLFEQDQLMQPPATESGTS